MISPSQDASSEGLEQQYLPREIATEDLQLLRCAYMTLEHPSLAARLSSAIGTPIETAMELLPTSWHNKVYSVIETALAKSLSAAVSSLRRQHTVRERKRYYKGIAAGSGAMGGLFGIPGLLLELPITTTLMLRSIAEIARAQGENIYQAETQAACLQVFALGGKSETDDAAETGYYGVRFAMSGYMSAAIQHISHHGVSGHSAPALVNFIQVVAKAFGTTLSQRAATQILPLVGAAGGAIVNVIFLQHFQDMAQAHFTVRRLERKYGQSFIHSQFELFEQEDQTSFSSR
ncbi:MAG: EcsC family protein [Gammaproteobacteria bacterium]